MATFPRVIGNRCCHLPEVKSGDTRGRAEAVHRFVLSLFLPHSCTGGNSWEIGTQKKLGPPTSANPIYIFIENVTLLTPQNGNRHRRVLVRGGRCIFLGLLSVWYVCETGYKRQYQTFVKRPGSVSVCLSEHLKCDDIKFPRCPK